MSAGDRSSRTAFRRGRSRAALVSDATTGRLRETPARIRRRSVLDARRARPPRAVPSSAATRGAVRGTPRGLVTRGKNGGRLTALFWSTQNSALDIWMFGTITRPPVASAPWRSLGACDARGTPGRRSGRRGRPRRKTTMTTRFPRAATSAPPSARGAPRPRRPRRVSGRSWHWSRGATASSTSTASARTRRYLASRYASRTIPSTDCGSCCGARTPPRT